MKDLFGRNLVCENQLQEPDAAYAKINKKNNSSMIFHVVFHILRYIKIKV